MATDNPTTTSNLTSVMQIYYDRLLLDRLEKKLYFYQFATKKPVPKNAGKTVYFTRYTNFAANTTALTEAVVPDGIVLSAQTVSATVAQYGDYAVLSDLLTMTAIDPSIKSALEVLAYRASLSIDTLMRNECDTNGTVNFANGKTALSAVGATDVFNGAEVRKAFRVLQAGDVLPHTGGDYIGLIHPNNAYDLQSDTAVGAWLDVHKYAQPKEIYQGEIGKIYGVRFMVTTNIAFTNVGTSGSANVYNVGIFGWNAYAAVELAGGNLRTYVKRGSESGVADPLEQKNTVGYKVVFAPKILDAARYQVWKSGSSF